MRSGIGLLWVGLAVILAGCGGAEKAAAPAAGGESPAATGRMFGVVFQTMNNPFFIDLNKGIEEVVKAHGDSLVTLDSRFDSLKQKNDISDLMLRGAAGLFINPVNWEGIRGSLIPAKEKGVPCIVVDAPVKDEDLVLSQVASDNIEAGRLAARALAKVKPEAKLVVLHHSVNKACIDRVAGFQEEAAKIPGWQVLDTQEGKGTTEGGLAVMRDLLGRFPEINAVFAINDPSALGAISALESAGKLADVTVVTVDGSAQGVAAIQAGKLLSTSAQFPYEMGKTAAEKMYEHLDGKTIDKEIKIRVELIDKDNAAAFLAQRQ